MIQARNVQPKILLVANDIPFPPNTGGRRDTYERLRRLFSLGYPVHLLATTKDAVDPDALQHLLQITAQITIVPRSRGIGAVISYLPFQHTSRSGLKKVSLTVPYEAVILESEYTSAILDNLTLRANRIALRVHNDEAAFYRALSSAASSWRPKLFYFLEGKKFSFYSGKAFARANRLWFISSDEMAKFVRKNKAQAHKAAFLPTSVDSTLFKSQRLEGNNVLYIGDLSLATNRESVLWYLANVHPQLVSIPGYKFYLAGKTGDGLPSQFEETIKASQDLLFFPDAKILAPLYQQASVFINPILRGAGLKIKTIDAAIAGVPIVSTSIGAEGSGLQHEKHLLIADSPEDFASGIIALLKDKSLARTLAEQVQAYLQKSYGIDGLEKLLSDLLA